jgi:hypothetical protein
MSGYSTYVPKVYKSGNGDSALGQVLRKGSGSSGAAAVAQATEAVAGVAVQAASQAAQASVSGVAVQIPVAVAQAMTAQAAVMAATGERTVRAIESLKSEMARSMRDAVQMAL